jgi:type II secretion system protein G
MMKACFPWRTILCGLLILFAGCGHQASDSGGTGPKTGAPNDGRQETLKALADLTRQHGELIKQVADGAAPGGDAQKELQDLGTRMEELVSHLTSLDPKTDHAKFQQEADRIWLEAISAHAPELKPVVEKIVKQRSGGDVSAALSVFRSAFQAFQDDNGRYPSDKEGIEALWKQPAGVQGWHPYLSTPMPNDPWGHAWIYRTDAQRGYVLQSLGPDGKPDSGDEITLSPQ